MPAPRQLVPWVKLLRYGMPQFVVTRRPTGTLKVGDPIGLENVADRTRLRQLYEQRLIAVVPGTETHNRKHSPRTNPAVAKPTPVTARPKPARQAAKAAAVVESFPQVPVPVPGEESGSVAPLIAATPGFTPSTRPVPQRRRVHSS